MLGLNNLPFNGEYSISVLKGIEERRKPIFLQVYPRPTCVFLPPDSDIRDPPPVYSA